MRTCGLSILRNMARLASAPKFAGNTTAARILPFSTSSRAAVSAIGCTSSVASACMAATIFPVTALLSRSTTAIGMREGLALPAPNSEPKKAAIRIGASRVISSERRLEKYRIRSLRTRARRAFIEIFMGFPCRVGNGSVAQLAAGEIEKQAFQIVAVLGDMVDAMALRLQPGQHRRRGGGKIVHADNQAAVLLLHVFDAGFARQRRHIDRAFEFNGQRLRGRQLPVQAGQG